MEIGHVNKDEGGKSDRNRQEGRRKSWKWEGIMEGATET